MLANQLEKSAGLRLRLVGHWLACFMMILGSGFLPVGLWAQDMEIGATRVEALKADFAEQAVAKAEISQDVGTKSEPEKWDVKLGGHVQMDYVLWANASESIPNTSNYFNFRRLRLVADGTGYDVCDFRLQMTLEPEPFGDSLPEANLTPHVKDAYFTMNEIPYLGRFRVGNFFVPYSLEQVTNDTNNIFLERSIPTQTVFAADREVGFAFYNCSQDERLTWSTGCFIDSISEGFKKRLDDNQGYRVSGRLTWLPYDNDQPKGRRLVHTGLGVLFTDDSDDRMRIRTRPQVSEGPRLIDSGVLRADSMTSGNLEGAIGRGGCSIGSIRSPPSKRFMERPNRTFWPCGLTSTGKDPATRIRQLADLFLGFVQESFGALGAEEQGWYEERKKGDAEPERASQECCDGRVVEAVESEEDEKQKEQCRSTVEDP